VAVSQDFVDNFQSIQLLSFPTDDTSTSRSTSLEALQACSIQGQWHPCLIAPALWRFLDVFFPAVHLRNFYPSRLTTLQIPDLHVSNTSRSAILLLSEVSGTFSWPLQSYTLEIVCQISNHTFSTLPYLQHFNFHNHILKTIRPTPVFLPSLLSTAA
jgi:hypothetical protein